MSVGMINQDLTRPLAPRREEKAPSRLIPIALRAIGALSLAVVFGIAAYVATTRDELGGEPFVVASIDRSAAKPVLAHAPAEATSSAPEAPRDGRPAQQRQGAGELENDAGVKVVRPGGGAAPGSIVIRVPDAQANIRLAPANDRRVSERGRHGLLPKQGEGGLRPADVYARPVTPQQRNAPVRVAILVGGLGIGVNTTQDAIQRLPSAVSLAFAPYGAEVERLAARARENGHEVLLQAPMEPFDYPDNDPGPHTLVSSLPTEQNMDRLHWLLTRVPGHVGLVNYMGGRFLSADAALSPVMKDLASRGLLFVDDGSSGRSLGKQAADAAGVSAGRADVVIDAVQRGQEIDAALEKLEKIARERGVAIGAASALPVSVERIARWARAAEARGITLVPISAVVSSPRRS
jgi:hypothetical protein